MGGQDRSDWPPKMTPTEPTEEQKKSSNDASWMDEAKKHKGKKESDSTFNKYLSGFWKFVRLPGYKTIIGSSFAWCGLFAAMVLINDGLPYQKNGAGAKNWAAYGQKIDWKNNGIPYGAIVHLDHDCDCKGDSNHVGFSDGNCTIEDLNKKGATIPIFGGNQSNTVSRARFKVCEICAVRWPPNKKLPGKVIKSEDCIGSGSTNESTR